MDFNAGQSVIVAALILAGAWLIVHFVPRPTGTQTGRYQFADGGSSGIGWRLDAQSGELLACFPFGPNYDRSKAECWVVKKEGPFTTKSGETTKSGGTFFE